MPVKMRLTCPVCGGFRFKSVGVDKLLCQDENCKEVLVYVPGRWRLADDETVRLLAERK